MITLSEPSATKYGGKFYNVSKGGEPLILTTSGHPLRTYGINRYGSVYLYANNDNIEKGVEKFMKEYEDLEKEIASILEERGEKVKKFLSRMVTAGTSKNLKRITVKFAFEDREKTKISRMIKDIENNKLTSDELKEGKCYEIYPVIEVKSIFVNSTKGIIPQLQVSEAFLFPVEDEKTPILNLEKIRERYASSLLRNKIKHIEFGKEEN